MSGLPPQRDVDANDTDFESFTAAKDGPFENVDYYQAVGAGYFETMGIPIVDGRAFAATDDGGAPVAIVNETLVRTFFPDRSPIGHRVRDRLRRSQPVAHHRRRRQGRQAGRRRSEDRHRAVLPRDRRRSPTRSFSRRRRCTP